MTLMCILSIYHSEFNLLSSTLRACSCAHVTMLVYGLCVYVSAAQSELVDKAKEIVKKLTFSFESDSFENPGTKFV